MSKGTKAFVIAANESHFIAYRATQREAAPFLVHVKTLPDLRIAGNAQVVCVGPFWTHPHWEELLGYIRRQTSVNPFVAVQWFPMILTIGVFVVSVLLQCNSLGSISS